MDIESSRCPRMIFINDYKENPDLFIRKSRVSEVNVCLEKSELKLEKKKFHAGLSIQSNECVEFSMRRLQAKFVR